jgi:hypothetical protein
MANGVLVSIGVVLFLVGLLGIALDLAVLAALGIVLGLFAIVGGIAWEGGPQSQGDGVEIEWTCENCGSKNGYDAPIDVGDSLYCSRCGNTVRVAVHLE